MILARLMRAVPINNWALRGNPTIDGLPTGMGLRLFAQGALDAILDLGAYIGECSILGRYLQPQARVIAVEPDSETFQCLKTNALGLDIQCVQVAIGNGKPVSGVGRAGHVSMAYDEHDGTGDVPSMRLANFWDEHLVGIDSSRIWVKLDIEGAERHLLDDAESIKRLQGCAGGYWEFHGSKRAPDTTRYVNWLREHFTDTHKIIHHHPHRRGRIRHVEMRRLSTAQNSCGTA